MRKVKQCCHYRAGNFHWLLLRNEYQHVNCRLQLSVIISNAKLWPPSNTPASAHSHIQSQGSCDHQTEWPWTGTRMLSLEIAPTPHTITRTKKTLVFTGWVLRGRTEWGAALRRQTAALEAGGVGRLSPTLSMGGFSGGRCSFVERCVIAATAGICRAGSMSQNRNG